MSNPKFINIEKKIPYSVRLPQRLIDKLNAYAELNGNTTTNIINNILNDFISDKVVLNDYLDNIGGVAVKIPYAINQKNMAINYQENLTEHSSDDHMRYYIGDSLHSETYFAELFEVKNIPNNLDIYDGDSYAANKQTLKFNSNAIHSGIELFIYNITEIIFADHEMVNKWDSFLNCLYCLYFEVDFNGKSDIYLVDYLTAINLLSASGNIEYKDLIIAAAIELENVDDIVNDYSKKFDDAGFHPDEKKNEIMADCKEKCNESINIIASKYNSNNIILFGKDIFSRMTIKEMKKSPDINDLIDEKIDALFSEKFEKLEKTINDIDSKIDAVNNKVESGLNETKTQQN